MRSGLDSCQWISITPVSVVLPCSRRAAPSRINLFCSIWQNTMLCHVHQESQRPGPLSHNTAATQQHTEPHTSSNLHLRQRGCNGGGGVPPRVGAAVVVRAPQRAARVAVHVHGQREDVLQGAGRRWCQSGHAANGGGVWQAGATAPGQTSAGLAEQPSTHLVVDGAARASRPAHVIDARWDRGLHAGERARPGR